jgi:uncharacterized short protein YbdD (DUF466 family)
MHTLLAKPVKRVSAVLKVVRRIIGVPDYDTYVEHCRTHHPGREPMSRREFDQQRMQDRYSRPGARCC